ncbi:MAG: DEAD/DEAH box helicase, partial [Gemmatimonadaceae bacterium]
MTETSSAPADAAAVVEDGADQAPPSFAELGLAPDVLRAIDDAGYTTPTPIQAAAIPLALRGRDLIGLAQTGTGKTAAFTLPIVHRLLGGPRRTRALILTPTRELCGQVEESFAKYGRYSGLDVVAVYGGVAYETQTDALRRGVDVVVATPGRLLDHLEKQNVVFDELEVLVLDEADRMLDMGFLPDIRRVLKHLPPVQQTMMFSATVPAPIRELAHQLLKNPVSLNVERQPLPATGIEQAIFPVRQDLKAALLVELLRRDAIGNAIVFTRTKHRANRVFEQLQKHRVNVARIHGNRSQMQRTEALTGFKSGKYRILVATDIAARGIDVEALSHVVNFDVPHVPEDYIHRVGRTARAELTGDAITFVAPDEENDLRAIERAVGKRLPRVTVPDFDYKQKPAERLEIPIQERIAAIRARKAEDRARAKAKAERRGAPSTAPRAPAARPLTRPSGPPSPRP